MAICLIAFVLLLNLKEALKHKGLVSQAIVAQLDAIHLPRNERESLVFYYHQRLQNLLHKRIWIFGTLSFICPLIGLLGTVLGVIRAFKDLAISGSGGPLTLNLLRLLLRPADGSACQLSGGIAGRQGAGAA